MSGESHLETSGHRPAPSGVSGVNPATGLASDYLNHFYEPLMLLEHIEAAPDLLADLAAWCPTSYAGPIGQSGRPDRGQNGKPAGRARDAPSGLVSVGGRAIKKKN